MIKPVGKRVLVRSTEPDTDGQVGSIIIPGKYKEDSLHGIVVGVGGTVKELRPGQHVMVSKHSGTEFFLNGVKHYFLKEKDVVGFFDYSTPKKEQT